MGAKASTANGGQSPRARTFSTSSSSDVVSGGAGFSLLRAIPGIQVSNDRQRARSLSSVPDLHASHEAIAIPPNSQSYEVSAAASPDTDTSSNEEAPVAGTSLALGRVYAAHSLPSHIWSINGNSVSLCVNSSSSPVINPALFRVVSCAYAWKAQSFASLQTVNLCHYVPPQISHYPRPGSGLLLLLVVFDDTLIYLIPYFFHD
ncbi:zinc and ring finger 2 [Danaus plexippus plexippus]|uniref:Zinc and ring finger 2 n=1 Tax=Danaus plexippus plexippus TaxID=278856 RepID=A0A212EIZ5_DANPL|nr:zinc and ring finger 2 [Danaus plexippus plexippus]